MLPASRDVAPRFHPPSWRAILRDIRLLLSLASEISPCHPSVHQLTSEHAAPGRSGRSETSGGDGGRTHPRTGLPLDSDALIPNTSLRAIIAALRPYFAPPPATTTPESAEAPLPPDLEPGPASNAAGRASLP